MKGKFLKILLCLMLVVCAIFTLSACKDDEPDVVQTPGEQKSIVFLGDSIAEAIIGVAPLSEREDYGYYGTIGQRNNFKFYNHSVSGHQTRDMLCLLTNPETNSKYTTDYNWLADEEKMTLDMVAKDPGAILTTTHIMQADIIHISIIGNDLLQAGEFFNTIILEAATNKPYYAEDNEFFIDRTLKNSVVKFRKIMELLRIMNPTADIIIQSVYNPIYPPTPLMGAEVRQSLSKLSPAVSPEEYRAVGDIIIPKMNKVIEDYYNANKATDENVHFVDVYKGFKEIADADSARGPQLIYSDGIHPSNEGHAVIADLIQEKLVEAGIVSEQPAAQEYKKLRTAQLDKLFSKDNKTFSEYAKVMINAASSTEEVTELFFRCTRGLTPSYLDRSEDEPFVGGYFVEETVHYDFVKPTTVGLIPGGLGGLIVGLIDASKSGITLKPDGTMELLIILDMNGINALLKQFNIDINSLVKNVDLTAFVAQYVNGLFPGFSLYDAEASLGLLPGSTGLELVGLDFESENIQKLVNALEAAPNNFSLPQGFVLPDGLGIKYSGKYYIRDVEGYDGETYKGVYVGEHHNKDGAPFVVMTMYENSSGNQMIKTNIEFIKTYVYAQQDTEYVAA